MSMTFGGRYEVIEEITTGGTGEVFRCNDKNLDRDVILKFLQPGVKHARIVDELAFLQSIRSKHVVEVYDVPVVGANNRMGIIIEFVDGNILEELGGQFSGVDSFLNLLYQLSSGLADIHEQGRIHRDIKPRNLKRDGGGIIKIFDFDLSRRFTDAKTKGFNGTRGYAAPELYVNEDEVAEFTTAVDIYAMAVTCVFAALGALPEGLKKLPPAPDSWVSEYGWKSIIPSLDDELCKLLDLSLSADPAKRPPAKLIRDKAARLLLRGKHRALFTYPGGVLELSASSTRIELGRPPAQTDAIKIRYNQLNFLVDAVSGDVYVNRIPAIAGMVLSHCAVITLGAPELGRDRAHVTIDIAHPEVRL